MPADSTAGTSAAYEVEPSSSPVSTPPKSPLEHEAITITASSAITNSTPATSGRGKKDAANGTPTTRKPRKKKEDTAAAAAQAAGPVKERKPRKPRDTSNTAAKQPARKKQRLSEEAPMPTPQQPANTLPANIAPRELQPATRAPAAANGLQPGSSALSRDPSSASANTSRPSSAAAQTPAYAQIGKSEAEPRSYLHTIMSSYTDASKQPPRPASGQRFDPIRSSFDPIRSASAENAAASLNASASRFSSPQSTPHARASPSIASLLDAGGSANTASSSTGYAPRANGSAHAMQQDSKYNSPATSVASLMVQQPVESPLQRAAATNTPPASQPLIQPVPPSVAAAATISTSSSASASATVPVSALSTIAAATPAAAAPLANGAATVRKSPAQNSTSTEPKASKGDASQDNPSPKPARQKPAPPPLPLGSGLLSSAAFGKSEPSQQEFAQLPNQCIVIDVPMKQENGNYVNFMREVEQKYGFDIAHPRLAEHRRRMAQIAAAGAALESGNGSADEMPIDVSDAESNVEMGGMDEDSTAGEGANKKKKKRKPRANAYDKNDDFIDDTELMWEEQALASQDGYFVWSGPLVPEAEKSTTERADGSTTRRGRGRGRGGAARGEGGARGGRGGGGEGSGGGRGSRGGQTVRKPRITKAERAKLEAEKLANASLSGSAGASAGPAIRALPQAGLAA